jgi:hypothetical protein
MTSTVVSSGAGHAPRPLSRPDCRLPSAHKRQTAPWVVILAVFLCFVSHTLAATPNPAAPVETLVIDHKALHKPPHPEGQRWAMSHEHEIRRRKVQKRATSDEPEESDSTESSEPSKTSATHSVTTTFSIGVGSPKSSSTSTTAAASALPSILDSVAAEFSLGPNGEPAPCPIFINSFLNDPDFKQCYPLSMLFSGSQSFYDAQTSLVSITRTLDATCAADVTFCTSYMKQLAQNLTAPENCEADYNRRLPSVMDIYRAMVAYEPVYNAGCLRDPETGAYCYANAVTNQTSSNFTYIYWLPLNLTLPGTTLPCGYCLRRTMTIYQRATADRTQLITNTYVAAAEQVNTICGPNFANESLAEVSVSAAPTMSRSATWLGTALPLAFGVVWLI